VYVFVLELLMLMGQAVRLECVTDVSHASQQHMDVLAASSHVQSIRAPVVAVQQVDGGTERPALVDANAT